jgi:AraC family transcriptional regulator of adaptative response / DNA-3-methyladenine glycosylase II
VSRALALIDTGALEEHGLDHLAGRLGVGERQLRRLFRQHLGASPVSVAQTKRVLLAKQLIQETRLPMAEVALASGFGSIRRFNEIFQRLFGRPPGALRRVTSTNVAPSPKGEVILLLRYRPPYDWAAMASFLATRAIPGVELVSSNRYVRTIEIDGVHGIVSVEPAAGNALRVAIRTSRLPTLPAIIARVRRVFDLAADPQAINAQLAEDVFLAPLVRARPGLRVPGAWDGFELAVRAVLGQQLTAARAVRLTGKLVARCGLPLAGTGLETEGLTHVFPHPEHLATARLSSLGMLPRRAATLASLARAVVADPKTLGVGRSLTECVTQLRALPGLGAGTAEYIATSELCEPDAFPSGDLDLLVAMRNAVGTRATPRELLARAECWRPWRAYAVQHLWASLRESS